MGASEGGNSMGIIDIAPGGDLLLMVGTKSSEVAMLRVHSVILKTVSKVFNAMFGPRFREGQAVGGDHPKEIALPEDDAIGMTILCQVMHHRYNDVPASLQPMQVLRVVQTADKYDCIGILEHIRTQWLSPSLYFDDDIPKILNSVGFADIGCLLAAAYVLDDATAFKELTRVLVLHYARSYLKLTKHDWASMLIPNIICLLEEKRSYLRTEIIDVFSDPHPLETASKGGMGREDNVPILTTMLEDAGLTPLMILSFSIMEVIPWPDNVCSPTNCPPSSQMPYSMKHIDFIQDYHREFSPHLKTRLTEITNAAGLCLDCVLRRTNGSGDKSSECRIQHEDVDDDNSSTDE